MPPQKATIQAYDPQTRKLGEAIRVLFNPNEYRLERSNQFAEVAIPGLQSPPIQFVRGAARTLSMQLFFDTYESGEDVRVYTGKIVALLDVAPELHAPPIVLFNWGQLTFVGVLERASQRFTLFHSDGVPARATVDVTIKECAQEGQQAGLLRSADFVKTHVLHQGETLSGIAGRVYGDPALWRRIAEANRIDDPFDLQPGRVLVVPALR